MSKLTDQFKNTFFRVDTLAQSERVQKLLFSLGYMWTSKGKGAQREVLPYPVNGAIYVDENCRMSHSDGNIIYGNNRRAEYDDLVYAATLHKREKTKKRKESRKRAKLRKQGWIINTGTEPTHKGKVEVLFNSGAVDSNLDAEFWCWDVPDHCSYAIRAWRPTASESVVSLDKMVATVAADLGKEVVSVPTQLTQADKDGLTADTNPKRALGLSSVPLHLWPALASAYGSLALYDGAGRYGTNNFKATNVEASIYISAMLRHIASWSEGEECDPVTGVPHLGAVLANVAILLESRAAGKMIDDRNIGEGWLKERDNLKEIVKQVAKGNEGRNPKHYTRNEVE